VACIYEYRKHPKLFTEYAYDAYMDTYCTSSSWPQTSQQNTGVLSGDAGATGVNGGLFRQRVPRPAGYYELSK